MSRLLHILSKRPDVQDRLRRELLEIKSQKNGQDLSYDELNSLPYLDAICRETLRLWAPFFKLSRNPHLDAFVQDILLLQVLSGCESFCHMTVCVFQKLISLILVHVRTQPYIYTNQFLIWTAPRYMKWLYPAVQQYSCLSSMRTGIQIYGVKVLENACSQPNRVLIYK